MQISNGDMAVGEIVKYNILFTKLGSMSIVCVWLALGMTQ